MRSGLKGTIQAGVMSLLGRGSQRLVQQIMRIQPAILRRCGTDDRRDLLTRLSTSHGDWASLLAAAHSEFGLSGLEMQQHLRPLFHGLIEVEQSIGRTLSAAMNHTAASVENQDEATAALVAGLLPSLARILEDTGRRLRAMDAGEESTDLAPLLVTYLETAFEAVEAAKLLNGRLGAANPLRLSDQQGRLADAIQKMTALLETQNAFDISRQLLAERLDPEERFQIPGFQLREAPVLNTWTYQNDVMTWDIAETERVLDVGSGGWPFRRATHLADMYMGETTHRMETLQRDGRPIVCLDIQQMPFKDKTWDFVFCSHVLEHLERPGDAIRELTRIGRRGYIEVPTRLSDAMLNFTRLQNHHKWHGMVLGGTLILVEWMDHERRDMGSNDFFRALMSQYHNVFQKYFEDNWDMFYAMLPWRDELPFIIINKNGRIVDRHDVARDK